MSKLKITARGPGAKIPERHWSLETLKRAAAHILCVMIALDGSVEMRNIKGDTITIEGFATQDIAIATLGKIIQHGEWHVQRPGAYWQMEWRGHATCVCGRKVVHKLPDMVNFADEPKKKRRKLILPVPRHLHGRGVFRAAKPV